MSSARALPLPTRDGVGPSCVALPAGAWPTIGACLVDRFPAIAPAIWQQRIDAGEVVDEHGARVTSTSPHRAHLRVYYYRSLADEPRVPFDEVVLFHDAHIVVADKPHFLPVTPSGAHLHETLLVRLKRKLGIDTLAPVHRIDRETAGLVLFSVDPSSRGRYQRMFAERRATKVYEAVSRIERELPRITLTHRSRLEDDPAHFMRMRETGGEPNSETTIEIIEQSTERVRLRLMPVTGKRHQLRVHCAALGLPIVGDRIYPTLMPEGTDDHALPLQLLAKTLVFLDPLTGVSRRFDSGRSLLPLAAVPGVHQ